MSLWRKFLLYRIARAEARGDWETVYRLQREYQKSVKAQIRKAERAIG